jgi:hypothetical protein
MDLWSQNRPKNVVAVRTTGMDVIPAYTAAAAGLNALTLGHGVAEGHLSSDTLLDTVRHVVPDIGMGLTAAHLAGCSDIMTKWEYIETEGRETTQSLYEGGRVSLLLVDSSSLLRNGVESARRVLTLIEEVAERLEAWVFVLKEHPAETIWGPLVCEMQCRHILVEAASADLHMMLPTASAVMLLDGYRGSAAVHALSAGVPTVVVASDPDESIDESWPFKLKDALEVASTADQVIEFLGRAEIDAGPRPEPEANAPSIFDYLYRAR